MTVNLRLLDISSRNWSLYLTEKNQDSETIIHAEFCRIDKWITEIKSSLSFCLVNILLQIIFKRPTSYPYLIPLHFKVDTLEQALGQRLDSLRRRLGQAAQHTDAPGEIICSFYLVKWYEFLKNNAS